MVELIDDTSLATSKGTYQQILAFTINIVTFTDFRPVRVWQHNSGTDKMTSPACTPGWFLQHAADWEPCCRSGERHCSVDRLGPGWKQVTYEQRKTDVLNSGDRVWFTVGKVQQAARRQGRKNNVESSLIDKMVTGIWTAQWSPHVTSHSENNYELDAACWNLFVRRVL